MQILFESWLRNWDEAWYGEIIKNMAVNGHGWLMPYWNGRDYFDHPPLYFWLSGLVVKLFGLGEWQVRIISVIVGIAATGLVYLIGEKLGNKATGVWASLIWLTLGQVVVRISHGNLEGLVVMLSLAVIYLYLQKRIIMAGIVLGLGFLVKGWLLGLVPMLFLASYEVYTKRRLSIRQFLTIGFMAVGVFGLWLVPAAIKFGWPVVQRYVFNPEAGRLSQAGTMFSWKFFEYLIRDVGWWWIAVVGGFILMGKLKSVTPLLVTAGVYIMAVSFLNEKSDWYLIPVYPLVALAIGQIVARWRQKWPKMAVAAVAIIVPLQVWQVYKIEIKYPDRSRVGAELGQWVKGKVPKSGTLILDDHDFTSFLFYSNQEMVYVMERAEKKPDEWWRLKYEELPNLVKEKGQVWLVTPDLVHAPQGLTVETLQVFNGYKLAKLTF